MPEQPDLRPEEERDNSHITQGAMDNSARLESLEGQDSDSVGTVELESSDVNDLVDLGTERFGLDKQATANNRMLLDALRRLKNTEEDLQNIVAEFDRQIAALERRKQSERNRIAEYIKGAEGEVVHLIQSSPTK